MTAVDAAVFGSDHRHQAVDADDATAQADREIDGTVARPHRRRLRSGGAVLRAGRAVFDDRAVARQVALGAHTIAGRRRRAGELVVSEPARQVIGSRPILAVLPERNPDFFFLHRLC